jgi:putative flippase GtrA
MSTIWEYIKTMAVSGSGALVSILITAGLTEYVFGREHYFTAYIIGVAIGVVYAFIMLSKKVFQGDRNHGKRFMWFSLYMALLVVLQTLVVKSLVGMLGVSWYLPVIAGTMLVVSFISFAVYKYFIFR